MTSEKQAKKKNIAGERTGSDVLTVSCVIIFHVARLESPTTESDFLRKRALTHSNHCKMCHSFQSPAESCSFTASLRLTF